MIKKIVIPAFATLVLAFSPNLLAKGCACGDKCECSNCDCSSCDGCKDCG